MRTRRPGEFSWAVFFRGIARALGLRGGRDPSADVQADDPWTRTEEAPVKDRFGRMLDRICDDALVVYADHDLPTLPGHYARAPGQSRWTFVAERLSPEDRWAMLAQYPPQDGWRFASLEDLGRDAKDEQLAAAARILGHARAIARPDPRDPLQATLERAVALGAEWQALTSDTAPDIQVAPPRPLDRPSQT